MYQWSLSSFKENGTIFEIIINLNLNLAVWRGVVFQFKSWSLRFGLVIQSCWYPKCLEPTCSEGSTRDYNS